jgi:hypothetical protein
MMFANNATLTHLTTKIAPQFHNSKLPLLFTKNFTVLLIASPLLTELNISFATIFYIALSLRIL